MDPVTNVFAVFVILATFANPPAFDRAKHAYAVCATGEHVTGASADMARKSFLVAGYIRVRDLRKGCDRAWHARAEKDGEDIHVSLTSAGQVLAEAD